jgi:hypothetical protein
MLEIVHVAISERIRSLVFNYVEILDFEKFRFINEHFIAVIVPFYEADIISWDRILLKY